MAVKSIDVTIGQVLSLRSMANTKRVGKSPFQLAMDDGRFGVFLDSLVPLLTLVRTVSLSAVEQFDASVAFGPESGIKFYFGDNFKRYILSKVEVNVPARTLAIHRLERRSPDAPIRTELTPAREQVALAHLHQLIRAQADGKEGPLLVSGSWNFGYMIGTDGNVWAVGADWYATSRRWYVDAYSVTGPRGWGAGGRVLSGE